MKPTQTLEGTKQELRQLAGFFNKKEVSEMAGYKLDSFYKMIQLGTLPAPSVQVKGRMYYSREQAEKIKLYFELQREMRATYLKREKRRKTQSA
jgi:hypothetical protein